MLAMVTRRQKAELSRTAVLTRKTDAWPPRSTPKLFTHREMRKAAASRAGHGRHQKAEKSQCQNPLKNDSKKL
jgi:hypothetical protein